MTALNTLSIRFGFTLQPVDHPGQHIDTISLSVNGVLLISHSLGYWGNIPMRPFITYLNSLFTDGVVNRSKALLHLKLFSEYINTADDSKEDYYNNRAKLYILDVIVKHKIEKLVYDNISDHP